MFSLSNQKILTYFKTYLEARSKEIGFAVNPFAIVGLIVSGMLLAATGILAAFTLWGFVGLAAAFPLGIASFAKLRVKESPARQTLREALKVYLTTKENRKLHKHLDRTAAQLLDASSYYWIRIREILSTTPWTNPDLPLHYQNLLGEIRTAADAAMDESAVMLVRCIGTPKDTKSKDFQQVMEDLADFDLDDAFKGLKAILKSDSSKYTFKSSNISTVFEPARDLAEKLKLLHTEVEDATRDLIRTEADLTFGAPNASTGIDSVLNTIRATKIAESELDEEQIRQRLGH